MSMNLRLALQGDLKKTLEEDKAGIRRAVMAGIKAAGTGAKQDLREETESALGKRMGLTWRAEFYPKKGESLGAAAVVFTKAAKVMAAFAEGETIRSKNGFFLAIPTDACPKKGIGGKRISPSNFPIDRYGPLRYVYRPGRPSLLVVDNQRARTGKNAAGNGRAGGFAKASQRAIAKGNTATVVMFILVPQVTLPKLFDVDATADRWHARIPELILQNWTE